MSDPSRPQILEFAAQKLQAAREPSSGRLTGMVSYRFVPALVSHFSGEQEKFRNIETEAGKRFVIHNAFANIQNEQELSAGGLQNLVTRYRDKYLNLPRKDHTITTRIAVAFPKSRTVRWLPSTIRFSPTLPPKFEKAFLSALKRTHGASKVTAPPGSWWCRARVTARTARDALELAQNDVDTIRGIWCQRYLQGWLQASFSAPQAISPMVTGPFFSVHHPDGREISSNWGGWLFPDYGVLDGRKTITSEEYKEMRKHEESVHRKLAHLPDAYQKQLERCYRRYARALDAVDWEIATLKLWGILETLTHSSRHDTVVNRSTILRNERELDQSILNKISDYRNRLVHKGEESKDAEAIVCELSNHVDRLLRYHLNVGRDLGSVKEAAEFLDLGETPGHLKRAVRFFKA